MSIDTAQESQTPGDTLGILESEEKAKDLLNQMYFSSFYTPDNIKVGANRVLDQEAALLKVLALGQIDNAVEHLSALWFAERGPSALKELSFIESFYVESDADGALVNAAHELENLINKYDSAWIEPLNRLAYVRFKQGKFEEAVVLCEQVLTAKPWHYGARSGVAVSLKKLGRIEDARMHSTLLLPPAGDFISKEGKQFNPRELWLSIMLREIEQARRRLRPQVSSMFDVGVVAERAT